MIFDSQTDVFAGQPTDQTPPVAQMSEDRATNEALLINQYIDEKEDPAQFQKTVADAKSFGTEDTRLRVAENARSQDLKQLDQKLLGMFQAGSADPAEVSSTLQTQRDIQAAPADTNALEKSVASKLSVSEQQQRIAQAISIAQTKLLKEREPYDSSQVTWGEAGLNFAGNIFNGAKRGLRDIKAGDANAGISEDSHRAVMTNYFNEVLKTGDTETAYANTIGKFVQSSKDSSSLLPGFTNETFVRDDIDQLLDWNTDDDFIDKTFQAADVAGLADLAVLAKPVAKQVLTKTWDVTNKSTAGVYQAIKRTNPAKADATVVKAAEELSLGVNGAATRTIGGKEGLGQEMMPATALAKGIDDKVTKAGAISRNWQKNAALRDAATAISRNRPLTQAEFTELRDTSAARVQKAYSDDVVMDIGVRYAGKESNTVLESAVIKPRAATVEDVAVTTNQLDSASAKAIAQIDNEIAQIRTQLGKTKNTAIRKELSAKIEQLNAEQIVFSTNEVTTTSIAQKGVSAVDEYILSNAAGEAFSTEQAAKDYIDLVGYDSAIVKPHDLGGNRWVMKHEKPVTNVVDFMKPTNLHVTDMNGNSRTLHTPTWLGQVLRGGSAIMDDVSDMIAGTAVHSQATLTAYVKEASVPLTKLSGAEQRQFTEAMSEITRQAQKDGLGEWWNTKQLNQFMRDKYNVDASDKVLEAYDSYIAISDFLWDVTDAEFQNRAITNGFKSVYFKDDIVNLATDNELQLAKIVDAVPPEEIVYFSQYGVDYAKSIIPYKDIKALPAGYKIVKLNSAITLPGIKDVPLRYIITNDVAVHEVPRGMLGYTPGSRIVYKDKHFVSQANIRKHAITGKEVVLDPITVAISKSPREGHKFAERLNKAMDNYKVYANDLANEAKYKQMHTDLGLTGKFADWDNFKQMISAGRISLEHKFELRANRELPSEMQARRATALYFTPEDDVAQDLASQAKLFRSERGEGLLDVSGDSPRILDPYQALGKQISDVTNLGSFNSFRSSAAERWYKTYGGLLKEPYTNGIDAIRHATFRDDLSLAERNTAKIADQQRKHYNRILDVALPEEKAWADGLKTLGTWVTGKSYDAKDGLWADVLDNSGKFLYNAGDTAPAAFMKNLTFHSYFSFFNYGQLFVQAQAWYTATLLGGVNGLGAAKSAPLMYAALMSKNPNTVKYIANKFAWAHGLKPAEFERVTKEFMDSGFAFVDESTQGYLERGSSTNVGGSVMANAKDKAGKALKTSALFFNEPERIHRMIAFNAAYRDMKKIMGKADWANKQFNDQLLARARSYTLQMDKVGASRFQKGVLSIPAQFMGYQFRLFEAMLPVVAGGSAKYSAGQKARLFAGMNLMYGATAMPFVVTGSGVDTPASAVYQWGQRNNVDPEVVRYMYGGLMNAAFRYTTGQNVDAASRVSPGAQFGEFIEGLTTKGSFMEAIGGATGSTIKNFMNYGGTLEALAVSAYLNDGKGTSAAFKAAILNLPISSVQLIKRGVVTAEDGVYIDRKGNPLVRVEKDYWPYSALGIAPESLKLTMTYNSDIKNQENNAWKNVYPQMQTLMNQYSTAANADEKLVILDAIKALSTEIDKPNLRQKVLKSVFSSSPVSRDITLKQEYLKSGDYEDLQYYNRFKEE